MLKKMQCIALFALLAAFTPNLSGTQPTVTAVSPLTDPELTVTKTPSSAVSLSWDAWSGTGLYQVTVTNLTTAQVEQSFSTGSTSTGVSSLSTGNTYRFSVEKNGFVIAEDVLM